MRPREALHKAKPVIARPKAVAIHGFMLWRKWPDSSMDCRVAALLVMTNFCRPSLAAKHSHIVFGHSAVIVINGTLTTYALDCTAQNVACEIAARLVALIRLPT